MITTQAFCEALRRNVAILQQQMAGLTQEDSLLQLPFRGNCLNWVMGHLANNRDSMLRLLGCEPALGAAGQRYGHGSEPVTGDSPDVVPLTDLLAAIVQSQPALEAALAAATEDQLNQPAPLGDRPMTVRERLFFGYYHETYHTGQTELLRQLAGKNDKVI